MSIIASPLMGLQFNVLRGYFPELKAGEQFESVLHSRSVYHLSSLNNVFLDLRSHQASDAIDNMHHGNNYLLYTEQTGRVAFADRLQLLLEGPARGAGAAVGACPVGPAEGLELHGTQGRHHAPRVL